LTLAVLGAAAVAPAGTAHAQGAKKPTAPAAPKGAAKPSDKDPELKKARDAYAEGEKRFKAGDYAGALTEFERADGIKPTPQSARYVGLANDKLGKLPEAVPAYERFLANVPEKMASEGEEVKKRVAAIKATPGKLHVETTPPGATVAIDGKAQTGVTPLDLEAAPGKHTLHFTMDGRLPSDKEVDVAYASKQDVKQTLEEKPAPPPPPPPVAAAPAPEPLPVAPPAPIEPRSKVPAYITGGLAVAAAGVGTAFGILALKAKSDYDKTPTAALADDAENKALVADMALGVALTLGVTSVVLFLSGDEAEAKKAQAQTWKTAEVSKPAKPSFQVLPESAL